MGTKMGQQIRYWIPAQDSTLGGAAPFLKEKNHLVDIFEKNQNDDKNTESIDATQADMFEQVKGTSKAASKTGHLPKAVQVNSLNYFFSTS